MQVEGRMENEELRVKREEWRRKYSRNSGYPKELSFDRGEEMPYIFRYCETR